MVVPKLLELSIAVCRQDRAYKDYKVTPSLHLFFFIMEPAMDNMI